MKLAVLYLTVVSEDRLRSVLDTAYVFSSVPLFYSCISYSETMSDFTAIAINFDPLTQRMQGHTAHGDLPFDVPYMSKITDNLWQGGCENGLVLPDFIDHLVSLYPWEAYVVKHKLASNLTWRMHDDVKQGFDQVDDIARWVNACRKSNPVLVHCQAGLNRSALVVARALMLEGMDARNAIELIQTKRSPAYLCNKSFRRWLMSFDR